MLKTYLLYNKQTNSEEYVKENNVIQNLYEGNYKLPNLSDRKLKDLKIDISKINNYMPLYDIFTSNLYLIKKDDLYNSVFRYNMRFPTQKLLNLLENKYEENKEIIKSTKNKKNIDPMILRFNRKYKLIKEFLSNFDLNVYLNTYIKALYDNKLLGKSITLCSKPYFIPSFTHIRPYYTLDEILCIGLNNKFIDESKIDKEKDDIIITTKQKNEICEFIQNNSISYEEIVNHHNYIIKNNMIGLIHFYSIQGSYIFNDYLRNNNNNYNCNFINNLINSLNYYIFNSPHLLHDIYVYRFVDSNNFIKDLKIGDTYTDKGFLSTSKSNFYKVDINNNTFGWFLMKIKIPKKFNALCIETISNFPKEEEIIIPTNTTLKLKSNNKNNTYYHPNKEIQKKIISVYEFEIVNQEFVKLKTNYNNIIPNNHINIKDYKNIDTIKSYSNRDLIINFIVNETNDFNLFNFNIGNKKITLCCEEYNSVDIYKPFYAIQTDKGFNIYTFDTKHNMLLFNIEINEVVMFINYNIKFLDEKYVNYFNSNDFIDFICKLSLKFNIQKVIYYCDYVYCTNIINKNDISTTYNIGSSFNYNIYSYLKYNKKKFNNIKGDYKPIPAFNYEMLDILENINPLDILTKKNHRLQDNIIYQNFIKVYKELYPNKLNCKDFYIWLVENKCGLIDDFIEYLDKIPEYENYNPFTYDYYIFFPMEYMIDNNIIDKNPYINLFSKNDINNEINRFTTKRIRRFARGYKKKYKTKNKMKENKVININEIY